MNEPPMERYFGDERDVPKVQGYRQRDTRRRSVTLVQDFTLE